MPNGPLVRDARLRGEVQRLASPCFINAQRAFGLIGSPGQAELGLAWPSTVHIFLISWPRRLSPAMSFSFEVSIKSVSISVVT